MAANEVDLEIEDADGCINETESSSYCIWQYFQVTVSNSSDPKIGGAKIAVCKFCDKPSVAAVLRGQQPTFWGVLY